MVHSNMEFDTVSRHLAAIEAEKAGGQETPPNSNTGVLSTKGDFLTFTLHSDRALEEAEKLLGSEGWEEKEHGAMYYASLKKRGNISILYNGKSASMGVHVRMSGQGMDEFQSRDDFPGWRKWFQFLLLHDVKVGRFDIACDDHMQLLSLEEIKAAIRRRALTTTYKQARGFWEWDITKEGDEIETIYFGSRQGDSMIRFYDWQAKHGGAEQFIRCEMELHENYAHRAVEYIAEGREIGALAASALASKLNFRVESEDANKSRWPVVEWWSTFTQGLQALEWQVEKVKTSLSSKLTWVLKSVAPTLAMLDEQLPDLDWLVSVIKHGRQRLAERPAEWDRIKREGVWNCHTSVEVDPFRNEGDVRDMVGDFFSTGALVAAGALPVYGEEWEQDILGVPHWAGD